MAVNFKVTQLPCLSHYSTKLEDLISEAKYFLNKEKFSLHAITSVTYEKKQTMYWLTFHLDNGTKKQIKISFNGTFPDQFRLELYGTTLPLYENTAVFQKDVKKHRQTLEKQAKQYESSLTKKQQEIKAWENSYSSLVSSSPELFI